VVSDDLDLGSVQNTATASGSFNGMTITSPKAAAIYPVDAKPAVDEKRSPTLWARHFLKLVTSFFAVSPSSTPSEIRARMALPW